MYANSGIRDLHTPIVWCEASNLRSRYHRCKLPDIWTSIPCGPNPQVWKTLPERQAQTSSRGWTTLTWIQQQLDCKSEYGPALHLTLDEGPSPCHSGGP